MPETDRSPIVLLHDSLGSVAQWRDFPEMLAQACGRTVLAYDRPGYGQSTPRKRRLGPDLFDEEAQIVFPAVRRGLDLHTCVLFGHSIGGPMALTIAAMHPGLCEAVISESGQAFVDPMTLEGVRRGHAAFDDAERFEKLARYHGDKTRQVLDSWPAVWFDPAFQGWSLDACLARITCPVLAIHGDQDTYGSTAFPQRIRTGVAGPAGMSILGNCGHFPHRTHPRAVRERVARFLGCPHPAPPA